MWRPYLDRKARERNPALWDAAAHKPQTGKKRAGCRKAARKDLALREFTLQSPEACCMRCKHSARKDDKLICELGSDFHGYESVRATHVCVKFSEKDDER
jgi:hypothetical protein